MLREPGVEVHGLHGEASSCRLQQSVRMPGCCNEHDGVVHASMALARVQGGLCGTQCKLCTALCFLKLGCSANRAGKLVPYKTLASFWAPFCNFGATLRPESSQDSSVLRSDPPRCLVLAFRTAAALRAARAYVAARWRI